MNQENNDFNPNTGQILNNQDELIENDFQNEGEEQEQGQENYQIQNQDEQEYNQEMINNQNNNYNIGKENEENMENNNQNIEEDFKQIEQEDANNIEENDNDNMINNEIINNDENNNQNINEYINNLKDINTIKDITQQNSEMSKNIINKNMKLNNNEQYMEDGGDEINENYQNENMDEIQNINDDNNMNENDYMEENDNNGEENMYENEEENEVMDNEEDNELIQLLQEMDFVLNSENVDEIMKNFITNIKNKLISLKEENNYLNVSLINSKEQSNLKIMQLKNIINQYKSMQNQKNSFTGSKEELFKLNNKINKYEFIISRLKMEKKMLESKIDNLKKDYSNEILLMKNLNNNEKQSYQKRINEMIKNENKNNNNLNISKKMFELKRKQDTKFFIDKINLLQENNEKLSNENINLDEENKELKTRIQKINLNSKYKDQIIKSLREKIQSIPNEYKDSLNSLVKSNEQSQFQINQLFKENDKLREENQMLNIEMNKLRENLGNFSDKKYGNNSIIKNYKDKLNKYRINIILLKTKIKELLGKKDFNNNTNRIDSEYNNLMRYKSSTNFFKP